MADRLPGTRRDFASIIGGIRKDARSAHRPTSTLRLGDWVIEARPTGLHATHPASGTTQLIVAAPIEEDQS